MKKPRTNELPPLELWSGVECTINRVGEQFMSQCAKNGHFERPSDLELFADLGIKRIRHPVIWETVQGNRTEGDYDFTWPDQSLLRLRELGIAPIAGLVHHGSGPRFTSLLDHEFPEKLARYARAIAERYPWIDAYTPVNEPLTTARFSALYGIWYPHASSTKEFIEALINQCRGVMLAMQEIRKVNAAAKLVQTEDMGRVQATKACAEQMRFENDRRWLSFDLLCGKVNKRHALWAWLIENGANKKDLAWMSANPCPPDIFGINHYPLSNRYLDHRTHLYPDSFHGGNSELRYADLGVQQAFDVTSGKLTQGPRFIAPEEILEETWQRYHLPIAVTEAHINGHREAQLRWLQEIWQGAKRLRGQGLDIRAVTPWSFLGSYDWNSLCSKHHGFYESGVYDIRTARPRPTAIAKMAEGLAKQGHYDHPVLRSTRVKDKSLLVTGGNGQLGRAFQRAASGRYLNLNALSREQLDITSREQVREQLSSLRPWAVINAAGLSRVDRAEQEYARAFEVNVLGAEILAQECERLGIPLLSFSSHLVFDGSRASAEAAYIEQDRVSPLNVYGHTKAEMERRLLTQNQPSLIVRTSALFSPWDEKNFLSRVVRQLYNGESVQAPSDIVISPTYVPELVQICLDLLIDGTTGLVHLANDGRISWLDFARQTAKVFALDERLVFPRTASEMKFLAARPLFSAIASDRVKLMAPFEESLQRCARELATSRVHA